MQILFQTHQAPIATDFKEIATEKIKSLLRFNVAIDRIEVDVRHEANPKQGKNSHRVVLTSKGSGPMVRAEAYGFNDVAAFDDAVKSFELQLRKIHEKSKNHSRESIKNLKS